MCNIEGPGSLDQQQHKKSQIVRSSATPIFNKNWVWFRLIRLSQNKMLHCFNNFFVPSLLLSFLASLFQSSFFFLISFSLIFILFFFLTYLLIYFLSFLLFLLIYLSPFLPPFLPPFFLRCRTSRCSLLLITVAL